MSSGVDGFDLFGNTGHMSRAPVSRPLAFTGVALAAIIGVSACSSPPVINTASHNVAATSATPSPPASSTSSPGAASASPGPTTPPAAPSPPPVSLVKLKEGSKGAAVTELQRKLTSLGYWAGKIDGKFGDATQQAVFALQKAAGIKATGTVSSATARALDAGVRPKARSTSGTLIEVDLKRDLVLFVVGGQVKYILNTSTGGGYTFTEHGQREVAVTPRGRFKTYRTIDGPDNGPLGLLWRPRFFDGGVAIHGDSYVPPHPVSHGCVRISNEAIDWVWSMNLDPIGTTVWVYR